MCVLFFPQSSRKVFFVSFPFFSLLFTSFFILSFPSRGDSPAVIISVFEFLPLQKTRRLLPPSYKEQTLKVDRIAGQFGQDREDLRQSITFNT